MRTYCINPVPDPEAWAFRDKYHKACVKAMAEWNNTNLPSSHNTRAETAIEIEAHPETLQKLLGCWPKETWNECNVNLIENESLSKEQIAFMFACQPPEGRPRLNGESVVFV